MIRKLSLLRKKLEDNNRFQWKSSKERYNTGLDSQPDATTPAQFSQIIQYADGHGLQRISETDPGPLGLNVIYTPKNGHKADIIFIHGLGGTSRFTWSKNKDPNLFWPLKFLPLEPDICLARISTFGYNANFLKAGNMSKSIRDFATALLFDLKYAKTEEKEDLNMGHTPLIFVVHSMGGLVIKEAYMKGENDPEYQLIIKAISAIIFLATPHRGSNLAVSLNRILQSSIITNSKHYVSELAKNSFTLQRLNDEFRHIAPRLDIFSFYETQPTSLGLMHAKLIVERDSSILGYPGEVSNALDADHHGVCKYDSPSDPNYIMVRNVLKTLMSKAISTSKLGNLAILGRRDLHDLKSLLAVSELPVADYVFFRDQWSQGTNDWILEEGVFRELCTTNDERSRLLWLNGGPATGKSVLSSFIINHLVEKGAYCQYFFIRFGDQRKRTLSYLIRSIAYQIAQCIPLFSQELIKLMDEDIDVENADPKIIWEYIFRSVLFKIKVPKPLYWIIDGLDEANEPTEILKLLSDILKSPLPIRILLVGRDTPEITVAFHRRIPREFILGSVKVEGHPDDLKCYIEQELIMPGSVEFKAHVIQRVIEGAEGNFLWVRLAVDKLNTCHRHADVELALQQLPMGMEALYDRIALSISQRPSMREQALTSAILQCVACSLRVLTVAELSQALDEDTSELLDFQHTIVNLCGGFVVVDNSGHVAMVHQTAREYLLSNTDRLLRINHVAAHRQMFLSCMRCLMTVGLRAKASHGQTPDFVDYAANMWSFHLLSTQNSCEEVEGILKKFLSSHWVLTWVQVLAVNKQLHTLVQTSKHLSTYTSKRNRHDPEHFDKDKKSKFQELIEKWAVDLVKLVGKFGKVLMQNPESIYKLIPPLCPQNSSIYQKFGKIEARNLAISGISTEDWDDSIARISLGPGNYASSILAAGTQIAVLVPSGSVLLYDSTTFEERDASPITHGERLYRMALNSTASMLVTYGYRTTKIWDVSTGNCKLSVDNIETRPRPLSMLFTDSNKKLLVGMEDRRIRSLDINQSSLAWELVADLEELELEGHFLNSASYMAFNKDGSLVAVAYRGHPLSAWETDGPSHIGHCWRKREQVARGEVIEAVWHPHSPILLGLYIEGVVFKWHPYGGEVEEMVVGASKLAISRDGNIFATGDVRGIVRLYTTAEFSVIYQLASPDTVMGLTFSPDLRRFYDVRGNYANAWEPNILMRFAERTADSPESESELQRLAHVPCVSMSLALRIDNVTVVASSPMGRFYCYGTERGTVYLHDVQQGKVADIHKSGGFLSIEKLAWSQDGRFVCFSNSSKRVYIVSITTSPAGSADPIIGAKTEISLKASARGPIIQLLFNHDSRYIFTYTESTVLIVSLESSSIIHSSEILADDLLWILHPQDHELIIGFGTSRIYLLDWSLTKHSIYTYEGLLQCEASQNPSVTQNQDVVERVLPTRDKQYILVQISRKSRKQKQKQFLYFDVSSFHRSPRNAPNIDQARDQEEEPKQELEPITPSVLPPEVSCHIAIALAFLPHGRLIFLSKSFSICSWKLTLLSITDLARVTKMLAHYQKNDSSMAQSIKPLFWLPGDLIGKDWLDLSSIWAVERSFLCPRNGEVAVVRCGALF
ncbi:NACHT and WD domain protein [Camillea tinctor]|nr:NACHT and WD domain protein [Camillea tinctor]